MSKKINRSKRRSVCGDNFRVPVYGCSEKQLKKMRHDDFKKNILPLIEANYDVEFVYEKSRYIIHTNEFGAIHYYPGVDKLMIKYPHRWISGGIDWIIQYLWDM